MKTTGICPKCQSQKIMSRVRVLDYISSDFSQDLEAVVYEDPNALIFKGKHTSAFTAWICGECGYTELFADRPEELFAVYYASTKNSASHTPVSASDPIWTCPNCGEQIEHNFDVCWNCGTGRDGAPLEDPNAFG